MARQPFGKNVQAMCQTSIRNKVSVNSASSDKEDFDMLFQNLNKRVGKETAGDLDKRKPYIHQQKGSVVYLRGLTLDNYSLKVNQIIKLDDQQHGMILSVEDKQVAVLILGDTNNNYLTEQNLPDDLLSGNNFTTNLEFGKINRALDAT